MLHTTANLQTASVRGPDSKIALKSNFSMASLSWICASRQSFLIVSCNTQVVLAVC